MSECSCTFVTLRQGFFWPAHISKVFEICKFRQWNKLHEWISCPQKNDLRFFDTVPDFKVPSFGGQDTTLWNLGHEIKVCLKHQTKQNQIFTIPLRWNMDGFTFQFLAINILISNLLAIYLSFGMQLVLYSTFFLLSLLLIIF